jgi:hypothetical protein
LNAHKRERREAGNAPSRRSKSEFEFESSDRPRFEFEFERPRRPPSPDAGFKLSNLNLNLNSKGRGQRSPQRGAVTDFKGLNSKDSNLNLRDSKKGSVVGKGRKSKVIPGKGGGGIVLI